MQPLIVGMPASEVNLCPCICTATRVRRTIHPGKGQAMNDHTFSQILGRQYNAALAMMRNAIEKCPDDLWQQRSETEAPFWQHALHVLFYTRLYCFESLDAAGGAGNGQHVMTLIGAPLKDYSEQELNRLTATVSWTGLTRAEFRAARVPTREELLNYLDLTQATCDAAMQQIAAGGANGADAPNPMPWMPDTRGELLLYNLRHLHHHLGRLHSMLGRERIRVDWISRKA
jgi:hypothetical protein